MVEYSSPAERLKHAGDVLQKFLVVAMKGPWTADHEPTEFWDGPLVIGPEFNNQGEKDHYVVAQVVGKGSSATAAYIALMHPENGMVLAKTLTEVGKRWLLTWEVFSDGAAWCCDDCDGMVGHIHDPCKCAGSLLLPLADSILERMAYETPQ